MNGYWSGVPIRFQVMNGYWYGVPIRIQVMNGYRYGVPISVQGLGRIEARRPVSVAPPRTVYDNHAVTAQSDVIIPPDPASFKLDEEEGDEVFYVAIVAVPNAEKRLRELIDERRLDGERVGRSIAFAADERDPAIAVTEIRVRHTAPPGL